MSATTSSWCCSRRTASSAAGRSRWTARRTPAAIAVAAAADDEEAVELANSTDFGLGLSVWTGSRDRGVRIARRITCYDLGHLYNLAHVVDQGLAEPPFFVQTIFGVLGGMGPELDNLAHLVSVADRLFGNDYLLSAFAAGKNQMRFATASALHGGNVRVGLEDSLYLGPGRRAASNAEQVAKVVEILHALDLEVASPDEARAILGLKGRDTVRI